jgi:hypothetical protein
MFQDTGYWILNSVYWILLLKVAIGLGSGASFGRAPIFDYAARNTSRPGPNAGIAATITLRILVDL